jgi:hypothetical protein
VDIPASDHLAHAFPVSVKGVAIQDGKVLLLENERNEWELPGGKLVRSVEPPVVSNEHKRVGLFAAGQVSDLVMPDGYKRSIATWFAQLRGEQQTDR